MPQPIDFQITWFEDGEDARLLFLFIDGDKVVGPADDLVGSGKVSAPTYQAAGGPSTIHHFHWSLWFENKTLTKLSAAATVGGPPLQTIEKSKTETDQWTDQGTL